MLIKKTLLFLILVILGVTQFASAQDTKVNNVHAVSYDGYCKVLITWSAAGKYNGANPDYYRVFRDGVACLDTDGNPMKAAFPKYVDPAAPEGTHKYTVKAHYKEQTLESGETVAAAWGVESDPFVVTVKPRDYSLISYSLKEIYNYRIGSKNKANSFPTGTYIPENSKTSAGAQGLLQNLTTGDSWRVAVFRRVNNYNAKEKSGVENRGYWYLFDKVNGRILRSVAGVYRSNGSTADYNENHFTDITQTVDDAWEVCTYIPTPDQAIGMGVDDAGNIVVRYGNAFYNALSTAYIIPYNKYATTQAKAKELASSTWAQITFPNDASDYIDATAAQRGRVDYFSIYGNMLNNGPAGSGQPDYAYILYSPGYTRSVYRAKISGAKQSGTKWGVKVSSNKYQAPSEIEFGGQTHKITYGIENFAFFIDGTPTRVMHEIRSNAYINIDKIAGTPKMTPVILNTGEVNQASGTTLYFKGQHKNGIYCNAMFLITSVSFHSKMTGSFQVQRATYPQDKDYDKLTTSDFDFGTLLPVRVFTQREVNSGETINVNSNSNFLYAEKIEYPDGKFRLFIHQYVPGWRFAMYELIPNIQFDNTTVTVTSDLEYEYGHPEDPSIKTDIKRVNTVVKWDRTNFDTDGRGNYKIKEYNVDVISPDGSITWHITAPGMADENGNVTYTISRTENGVTTTETVTKSGYTPNDYVDAYDVPLDCQQLGEYTSTIQTSFFPKSAPDKQEIVDPSTDKSNVDYNVVPPTVEAQIWKGIDEAEGKYRVDLQFEHKNPVNVDPSEGNPNDYEPVTHYELVIKKEDGTETKQFISYGKTVKPNPNYKEGDDCCSKYIIEDTKPQEGSFYYLGEIDPENVKAKCSDICSFKDAEEYEEFLNSIVGQKNKVPGISNLTEDRKYPTSEAEEEGARPSNITFYPEVKPGEDPTKWEYIIQPVYAAGTPIEKRTSGSATVTSGGTTGVGSVGIDNEGALSIYPNPAEADVTVSLGETINSINIFNTTGGVVKSFSFNGDRTSVEINVESLSAGVYFLNVNGKETKTLIKK